MQTNRDAQIVDWLGRIGAGGVEHVSERFGMSQAVTFRRLRLQAVDGLLRYHRILYARPGMYTATPRGLRWRGLGRLGVFHLSPGGFEHAWQVAATATALHRTLGAWRLLGEREVRALEIDENALLACAELRGSDPKVLVHRPDLALMTPSGRTAAVEVELSVKAPGRLAQICRAWARARHVDHVYYLATPEAARAVNRALDRVKATDRVTVLDLEDVAGLAAHAIAREEARNVLPS